MKYIDITTVNVLKVPLKAEVEYFPTLSFNFAKFSLLKISKLVF